MPEASSKSNWWSRFVRRRHESWKQVAKGIVRPRFVLTFVALLVLSVFFSRFWVFEYAGIRSQEILQRELPVVQAEYARVIFITPEDYSRYFDECLEAARLDAAIDRILQFKPAILVVDLDTSPRRFRHLKSRTDSNIVWARDAEVTVDDHKIDLGLLPIRGEMNSEGVQWGLDLMPRSSDWTVRTYRRTYPVGSFYKPSLHWEAVSRFCALDRANPVRACASIAAVVNEIRASRHGISQVVTIPLLHARYQFDRWNLGDILGSSAIPSVPNNDLYGKIVLLGGAYSPQDKHQTPFGVLDGVELTASAVEAELNPQSTREMNWAQEIGLKVILGLTIAIIHHFLRPFYALVSTVGFLAFLVFLGSVMAALFGGYRADFVPFLLGILIEQLYHGTEQGEHDSEINSLKATPIK